MTVAALTSERVAPLRRYRPGRAAGPVAGKLSANENALGPAPGVITAVATAARRIHRYATGEVLARAVARDAGVAADRVVLTSGSDELCYLLATLLLEDGAPAVISDPCYLIDEHVSLLGRAEIRRVPIGASGGHDLDAIAAAAAGARLVWLPSPHNPTGAAVDPGELDDLIAALEPGCLLVLDEAYRDYVDDDLRPDVAALLARHDNLVVQRTFSKAYGLAGLRLGYGLGAPHLIAALQTLRPPFNVNAVAIEAGLAALAAPAWRDYGVTLVRREREGLELLLAERGVPVIESQANFVCARPPALPALHERLAAAGLAVRDGGDLGMPGWVRISVGAPPQMALLRAVLIQHLDEEAG